MAKKGRKGKGQPNVKRAPSPSKCRDCGCETTVNRYEFFKASRPRCPACGGSLEYQGSWAGARS